MQRLQIAVVPSALAGAVLSDEQHLRCSPKTLIFKDHSRQPQQAEDARDSQTDAQSESHLPAALGRAQHFAALV